MTTKNKKHKKPLRILVLFEVHDPPAPDAEYERRMKTEADWLTEGHVVAALKANGHEVHLGAIYKHPREVIDLVERIRPDLVWNFVQTFHGTRYYESHVAGVLELCRVPYTGCGHRALMLCQDKALSKEILKHHRVAVPPFVVSRRSQGVSVGINLNPNNACNWRCVYCQVEGLVLGKPPPVDLELLGTELERMLEWLVRGDFMQTHVAPESRRFNDIAFSGNGEPTSSPQFADAVDVAIAARKRFGLERSVKLVLITNGSLVHRALVQEGLERMAYANAEIWYKLDSATDDGQRAINQSLAGTARARTNLRLAASLVPTWLQTILLARNGEPPSATEQEAYLEFLDEENSAGTPLRGVLLYGLARKSYQPEAPELSALPIEWLEAFAARVRERGFEVRVFA